MLRAAVDLLTILFQHIFLSDEDALSKFSAIARWPQQLSDSTYDSCLCVLTSRYCFSRLIDAIQEVYIENSGNDMLQENNFNGLCLIAEQMVYSHYNPLCSSLETREDNGLTYLLNSSDVPPLVREYFKY